MMQKHWGKITTAVIVLLFVGAIWYANTAADRANEGVVVTEHIKGNPDGAVTLVEYSDFQCPSCANAAPAVAEVMKEYGDTVRFEYRHFPLVTIHAYARQAAQAAEAAGQQDKFWEMHDMLFDRQQTWSTSANPAALFASYAEELGLDMNLFRRHMSASALTDVINNSFADARERGFTGTPTFLLNGTQMSFSTFDGFAEQIAAAVAKANGETVSTTETDGATTTAADLGLDLSL